MELMSLGVCLAYTRETTRAFVKRTDYKMRLWVDVDSKPELIIKPGGANHV